MEFAIQTNVGESPQEALETIKKHERGEKYVVNQLGVLNWQQFYALFSPTGLMLIESFVKSHNGILDESLCDYQPIDPMSQSKNVKVSEPKEFDSASFINDAKDVVRYLRSILDQNDPVALDEAIKVVLRSDGLNKLMGDNELNFRAQHVPTLSEMISNCDLSTDYNLDLVEFEIAEAKAKEDI